MKAVVRQIGQKACYTFEDETFFFCPVAEAIEDLQKAREAKGHTIEVDEILYILAR